MSRLHLASTPKKSGVGDFLEADSFHVSHAAQNATHIPGGQAIWVFILGDMTMFAIFFGQFLYDRARDAPSFSQSQHMLNINFGAINALILLTGSLFVVLGEDALKRRVENSAGSVYFALALLSGAAFGVNKLLEYGAKLSAGITPETNLFFSYYYMYTGIHAVHLLIGMAFLGRMWQLSCKSRRGAADIRFIEVGASYWHLVDLLWIVLFALLYLMN